MLRAENLVKNYGSKRVVDGVSIYVKRGEIVGLLGPNGAGKTTIFYSIMGIIRPDRGKIFLDDAEITDFSLDKKARMGIGYLAQEPSIFRGLTTYENLLAVAEFLEKSPEEIEEVIEKMQIHHCRNVKASHLSGGEKRRTEISRILLTNPSFLLLDEPFVGIDPIAVSELKKIVLSFKEQNLGILITDHNVWETLKIIDRAYIIHKGKILIEGDRDKLLASPEAREIYLGKEFAIM
ncbi:MAG: LPS export ABC transporter ATP-binding protein [Elusimicrobia bacterium]|nr:LPS export ABC transporter ATP-binding protein [Elusimicrobiota bacterium]